VCHPHPLYGGTLHNKLVFHAAKGALQAGLPTLRFNFRGVGKSQGSYDSGKGEQDDVRAAIDYLSSRFPRVPVCVIGFSFGAWVGLNVGATDRRVAALVGLGIPVAAQYMGFLREVRKPKLIVQGTEDLFGPKAQVEALFAEMPEPKRLHWVQGVDHSFTGKLSAPQEAIHRFLEELAASLVVEKHARP
jgi:alpha/beta superfamily hydrolase